MNPSSQSELPKRLREIYHIAFLLRQRLPSELVPRILDFAEFWIESHSHRSDEVTIADHDLQLDSAGEQLSTLYLTSTPVADTYATLSPLHPVRKIVFTIHSLDIGWRLWSDPREDHGSYRNSWAWFEAEMLHSSQNAEAQILVPRYILPNVRADTLGYSYSTKVQEWRHDAQDEGERAWVRALQRSSKVAINVRVTKFPAAHVLNAGITIWTSAMR
jgi:hypothetical protein